MPTKVVYLHGMGGTPNDWRQVQARQPGLALPLQSAAETPEACAILVANAVMEQVSGSFALCGYSMGGRIAVLAAATLMARNRKPDGLILVSSGFGYHDPSERTARIQKDEEWVALLKKDSKEFWEKWYQQDIFASFQALSETTREAWIESRKAMDINYLAAQLQILGPGRHDDLFPRLRELAAKGLRTLYLAGELDKKYVDLSQKVKELAGVSVDIIPGAGHILPLEAPEALAKRISKFVK